LSAKKPDEQEQTNMSWQATTWVTKFSRHRGSDLLTLMMISNHSDPDGGNAFPSVRTLAGETRLTIRAVQYILRRLADSGELKIAEAAGPGGTNMYTIVGMATWPQGYSPEEKRRIKEQWRREDEASGAPHEGEFTPPHEEGFTPANISPMQTLLHQGGANAIAPIKVHEGNLLSSPKVEDNNGSSEAPKTKSRTRKKAPATPAPDTYPLDEGHLEKAREYGFRGDMAALEFATKKFLSFHKARGTTFASWDAGWQTWIMNTVSYGDDLTGTGRLNGSGPYPPAPAAGEGAEALPAPREKHSCGFPGCPKQIYTRFCEVHGDIRAKFSELKPQYQQQIAEGEGAATQ
jgi:hypothetical protein